MLIGPSAWACGVMYRKAILPGRASSGFSRAWCAHRAADHRPGEALRGRGVGVTGDPARLGGRSSLRYAHGGLLVAGTLVLLQWVRRRLETGRWAAHAGMRRRPSSGWQASAFVGAGQEPGGGDVSDEIHPYVVYRIDGGQMECALWRLEDGRKALALFLSGDAAMSYRECAKLGPGWAICRPAKEALLQLLKGCFQSEIGHAVLDPDHEKAKRIFDIHEILVAVGEQG